MNSSSDNSRRRLLLNGLLLVAGVALSSKGSAHHSIANFDRNNPIIVNGTLKEFVWANPHTWMYLMVPNDKGGVDEWPLEGVSVAGMARAGWGKKMLQPGQKVRVRVAPRKDGEFGGEWLGILEIDGKAPVLQGAQ